MARTKIYKADFVDKEGTVQYDYTFEAMNRKEANLKARNYKQLALPYPGSGKFKTVIKLTGKL